MTAPVYPWLHFWHSGDFGLWAASQAHPAVKSSQPLSTPVIHLQTAHTTCVANISLSLDHFDPSQPPSQAVRSCYCNITSCLLQFHCNSHLNGTVSAILDHYLFPTISFQHRVPTILGSHQLESNWSWKYQQFMSVQMNAECGEKSQFERSPIIAGCRKSQPRSN